MSVIGVIPARFHSSRLEGKPLADIHGKPMIQLVYEAAKRAKTLDSVVVATDDRRISHAVRQFGGEAVMTDPNHSCGTERVAEVAKGTGAEIVVNIQGDEPLLDPGMIDECVNALRQSGGATLSTLVKRIGEEGYEDRAVVKVVRDLQGRALYFSRSLIPFPHRPPAAFVVFEHIGLYAYTNETLHRLAKLPPTPLEIAEGLEQLRALENGIAIQTAETRCTREMVSVDTQQDLERVRQILANGAHT